MTLRVDGRVAIALREGPFVLVTAQDGSMPAGDATGLGLYVHDVRFVSAFDVRVNGVRPILLGVNEDDPTGIALDLASPRLDLPGGRSLPPQALSVRRVRCLDGGWRERISVQCLVPGPPVEVVLEVAIDADFADIFAVRGYHPGPPATVTVSRLEDGLGFSARGVDHVLREARVRMVPAPDEVDARVLRVRRELVAGEAIGVEIVVESHERAEPPPMAAAPFDEMLSLARAHRLAALARSTRVETRDAGIDRVVRRSALDLESLVEHGPDGPIALAGLPWYAAPFGRDALIVGFQTLAFRPELAVGALRALARHQGRRIDPFTEEEPGKIMHELRRGELARAGAVPHRPFYGTIDATPLFAWLFVEAVRWTGDPALYAELLPSALAALRWCDTHGDPDGDGFVEYGAYPDSPARNQGWKDSPTSLAYRDGTPAALPAALCEVQAYVYAAKQGLADLADELGDTGLGARLAAEAVALRDRFERWFWLPAERCYAQGLDRDKRPIDAVTSNSGHALWAGIASPERAALVADRLLDRDLFSGWGIRTLSSRYPTYNPVSYHEGSVWPHDNAIIAAGMTRYGHRAAAGRVIVAILEAAQRFPGGRLPELYGGLEREGLVDWRPAESLESCSPQAWAAGAPFLLLQAVLGLRVPRMGMPIADPALPAGLERLSLRGMRVGGRRWTIGVRRGRAGRQRIFGDVECRPIAGPERRGA